MNELVERAMHGDREAFGALASQYLPRLVGTAGLIIGSRDAAEDVAQETLVRAWRDLPTLREPDRFEAWMYRILVRACHDQRRRDRRSAPLTTQALHPTASPDLADTVARRALVDASLARLTPEQRAVLVLRYYLDMSLPDMSAALGIPVGTVKSRLHRAHGAIEAAMAAEVRGPAEATA
jgi:RNA polymerase sigma-70 factor, ECF subfamily